MMKQLFFLLIGFLSFSMGFAQSSVNYQIEPEIEKVLTLHKASWLSVKKVTGYTIQLAALSGNNSRTSTEAIKKTFLKSFPNIPCYLSYAEPNFRVRVGNFRTRIEAFKTLQDIQMQFPGAFVVKDKISYTNL